MHLLDVSSEISFVTADSICLVLAEDLLHVLWAVVHVWVFVFLLNPCSGFFFLVLACVPLLFPKPLFTGSLTVKHPGVLLLEGI